MNDCTNTGLNSNTALNSIDTDNLDDINYNHARGINGRGMVTLKNTIVTYNINNNLNGNEIIANDCLGDFLTIGLNIIDDPHSTCTFTGDPILKADPLMEALADNGGRTFTHALPADSPALDQIDCIQENTRGLPGTISTDQRDVPRPQTLDEDFSMAL